MSHPNEDPVVSDSRREAVLTLILFAIAASYTVGYSTLFGYDRDFESMTFVLGVPDWVFWGIIVPWCACTLAGWLLSIFVIRNNVLEEAAPPPDGLHDEQEDVDV